MHTLFACIALSSASAIQITPRAASPSLTCGQKGWAKTDSIFDAGASGTFTGCLAYCEDTPDCHSFALTFSSAGDSANCLLFSVPVAGGITVDDNSPWTFFDLGCPQPNQECGLAGYSRNDSYVDFDTNDVTACASKCLKDKYRCASYAYDEGQCFLYKQTLADNLDQDPSSTYTFYDQRCTLSTSSSGTSGTQPLSTTTAKSTSTSSFSRRTATTTSGFATTTRTLSMVRSITTTGTTKTTTTSQTASGSKTTTLSTKTTTNTTKAVTSATSSSQAVCIPYY